MSDQLKFLYYLAQITSQSGKSDHFLKTIQQGLSLLTQQLNGIQNQTFKAGLLKNKYHLFFVEAAQKAGLEPKDISGAIAKVRGKK